MQKTEHYINPSDEERIRQAVADAESRTCGEIVPIIVRASDAYAHLHLMGGIAFAITAFVLGVLLSPESHPSLFLMLQILGYGLGSLLFRIDPLKRLFLTQREIEAKVFERAVHAFHEHNLHKTQESTGILIMASLLEHRVQILADSGINEKVGNDAWQKAAGLLIQALKEDRPGDGFCEAIAVCGEVLAQHFPATGKNPNELLDQIIIDA